MQSSKPYHFYRMKKQDKMALKFLDDLGISIVPFGSFLNADNLDQTTKYSRFSHQMLHSKKNKARQISIPTLLRTR